MPWSPLLCGQLAAVVDAAVLDHRVHRAPVGRVVGAEDEADPAVVVGDVDVVEGGVGSEDHRADVVLAAPVDVEVADRDLTGALFELQLSPKRRPLTGEAGQDDPRPPDVDHAVRREGAGAQTAGLAEAEVIGHVLRRLPRSRHSAGASVRA